jgi:hypothetical protein
MPKPLPQLPMQRPPLGELLPFTLDGNPDAYDIYNPSIPFAFEDTRYMLQRVESVGREDDSTVCIFDADKHCLASEARIEGMQDPYYLGRFKVEGMYACVFGGVQITTQADRSITYQDVCYTCPVEQGHPLLGVEYIGKSELNIVMRGIQSWKDTRMKQLIDSVAVFARPQGEFGGLGTIGFFESATLDAVTEDLHMFAERADPQSLITGLFADGEWGGVNQIRYAHADGTFELIGHRARWVERAGQRVRDYEAIAFEFNKYTRHASNVRVIATADDFEPVSPKQIHNQPSTLGKVVFPAGIVENQLYVGVADRKIGRMLLAA